MISKAVVVGIYQRKLEEIARHADIQLTVLAPSVWNDPSGPVTLERAFTSGYDLRVEPIRFNGNFHLFYFPTLARWIRELRPDVIHIDEEPYNLATWHSLYLARRSGAKTLFFTWQNILRRYPFPFNAGESWAMRRVDYALAGTESAAQVLRAKGYAGRLAVIPQFGVDPELFTPGDTPRRSAAQPFIIGYSGRLVPEKGVDLLLRALAAVPGMWRLEIIGQGPERDNLQQLARQLGLGEKVLFVGQVPSLQMPATYRRLDALVVPSLTMPNWKEQFGRVITEAMACGVCVIGSDSGAIPDLIGDAGLIFREGDCAALAERLTQLITDPALYRKLSARGRERILAHYTHSQIATQTIAVYRELLRH